MMSYARPAAKFHVTLPYAHTRHEGFHAAVRYVQYGGVFLALTASTLKNLELTQVLLYW
jgi:hypothetical protein